MDGTLELLISHLYSPADAATFSSRTSVKDKLHGTEVALTEAELDLIHRLAKSENPDADYDP